MLITIIILAIVLVWFVAYKHSESDESFSDEELDFIKSYREKLKSEKENINQKINDIHKIVKK